MSRYRKRPYRKKPIKVRNEHQGYYYDNDDELELGYGVLMAIGLLVIAMFGGFIAYTAEPVSKKNPFSWTQLYTGRDMSQPRFDIRAAVLGSNFGTIQNLNPGLIVSTNILGEKRLTSIRPEQSAETKIWFMNHIEEQKRKSYRIRHEQVFKDLTVKELEDHLSRTFGKPGTSACKKSTSTELNYCTLTWQLAQRIDLTVTMRINSTYKQKPTIRLVADATDGILLAQRERLLEMDVMTSSGPEDKNTGKSSKSIKPSEAIQPTSKETLPF